MSKEYDVGETLRPLPRLSSFALLLPLVAVYISPGQLQQRNHTLVIIIYLTIYLTAAIWILLSCSVY